jgi:hypothetical protein
MSEGCRVFVEQCGALRADKLILLDLANEADEQGVVIANLGLMTLRTGYDHAKIGSALKRQEDRGVLVRLPNKSWEFSRDDDEDGNTLLVIMPKYQFAAYADDVVRLLN